MKRPTVIEIIKTSKNFRLGLKYLIYNNKSNLAPYHNLNHMLVVLKHCYNALFYLRTPLEDVNKCEGLLLAALFHDFNHSMGENNDEHNVNEAKLGLCDFVVKNNVELDINFMCEIINATQYPYVIKPEDLNIYQAIIRDADLCQNFEPDWLKQIVLGLSSEMKIPIEDLVIGYKKFFEEQEFITDYGKYVKDEFYPKVMEEYEILINILK